MVEDSSPITSRRVLRQLSAACKWAVESNYISVNPFLGMAQERIARGIQAAKDLGFGGWTGRSVIK